MSCDCEFTPYPEGDEDHGQESWHYQRTCQSCGHVWFGLHCPHDGVQNPCPGCGVRPTPALETTTDFLAYTLETGGQPMPSGRPWLTLGDFTVEGTITVDFVAPAGFWRPKGGRRLFLEMVRPHMTKRRFRRLRGRVAAAVRRALA